MPVIYIICSLILCCIWCAALSQEPQGCTVFPCDGPLGSIICHGPILRAGYNYNQSEYRLRKLLASPQVLEDSFIKAAGDPVKVVGFFQDKFAQNISGLSPVVPKDWKVSPKPFQSIQSEIYKKFAHFLNERWKNLAREVALDVKKNSDRYSLIWVPHPFIVPGGRFQEYFYWDSFWIVKGLLFCDMDESAKNILRNFAYMIAQHGHMLNYNRWGALKRSQPPLFAATVHAYYEKTGDLNFVKEMMPALEREFKFWTENRTVQIISDSGDVFELFQYKSEMNCPRSEEYTQDVADAANSTLEPGILYANIASACESGWDFSSRWFAWEGKGARTKSQCRTMEIVPVDLNAFMCRNMQILSDFYKLFNEQGKQMEFLNRKVALINATERWLWNPSEGAWFDLDLTSRKPRKAFYVSNIFPVWADCYFDPADKLPKVLEYWRNSGVDDYPGGIPTSLSNTGQQWDFPNAWAPLVHLAITGFRQSNFEPLQNIALNIAQKWVRNNYIGWKRHGQMFEKYDVRRDDGSPGGGGEYLVQEGFGWTNGAVLDLLRIYGDELSPDPLTSSGSSGFLNSQAGVVAGIAVLFALLWALGTLMCHLIRRKAPLKRRLEEERMKRRSGGHDRVKEALVYSLNSDSESDNSV